MLNIFIFSLLCYGICNIIVFGSIFEQFRLFLLKVNPNFLGKLFTCMMCLPFWVGCIISNYCIEISSLAGVQNAYLIPIMDGFLASGVVWLIHTIQESFERHNN